MKKKNIKYFIYDDCNKLFLNKLFLKENYKIFNFRKIFNSKLNKVLFSLKFLIQNLFSFKNMMILIKDGFHVAIICNEIKNYKPKFVITTTDNDLRFYLFKKYFDKNIKFIAIQNGIRSRFLDMFDNPLLISQKKYLSADYYLSFGSNIKNLLNIYIKAKVIPIGSFKSNFVKINKRSLKYNSNNCILYISTFRDRSKFGVLGRSSTNKIVYNKEILNEEISLIKNLKKYCIKNKLKFSIAGASLSSSINEMNFYRGLLANCNWKFYERKKVFSNYKLIENFEIIISNGGTLGYEALGRNKKVAFFLRNFSPFKKDWLYGWPDQRLSKGFFYTNSHFENEINRILNNLRKVKNSEWNSILMKEKNRYMHFYPDNKKLNYIFNQVSLDPFNDVF